MPSESSITVRNTYQYHASVVFGLAIYSSNRFPLVVGYSLRTEAGKVIDLPARRILEPGLALWPIEAPAECARGGVPSYGCDWSGEVIFALWRDATFQERLADTGWFPWLAPWLIGSSAVGLDMHDAEIEEKYGSQKDIWETLQ